LKRGVEIAMMTELVCRCTADSRELYGSGFGTARMPICCIAALA